MLNVLYLLNFAGKAGTERYVETLVKYLYHKHIRPFFAYNQGGLLVDRMEEAGVPMRQTDMPSRFDFHAARRLAELCWCVATGRTPSTGSPAPTACWGRRTGPSCCTGRRAV